ncbi:MAG: hypothetical protein ACE5I4_02505 [Thermoplasmata archaeon]
MIERETAQEILNALPGQLDAPRLLLVGVGGAGINMLRTVEPEAGLRKVAFDTDNYALALSQVPRQVHLRTDLPRGTGGDPDIGEATARRQREDLRRMLDGDIVLILAGLGRGTGTGVAPEVARLAKEGDIPVLAFLAWPFANEDLGPAAQQGQEAMEGTCDGLVVLDNEAAFALAGIETRSDAAQMVNATIGRVLLDLCDRVHDAFPFNVREELADFIGSVPEGDAELPVRAAQWDDPQKKSSPLPVDPRGIVEFR